MPNWQKRVVGVGEEELLRGFSCEEFVNSGIRTGRFGAL